MTTRSGAVSGVEGGQSPAFLRLLAGATAVLEFTGKLIVVVTLSAMFLALFVNVVLRYALGEGITEAYEIHAILFPWLIAGGAVVASARSRQIAVTVLVDRLGDMPYRIVVVLVHLLVLTIVTMVLWEGQPIILASQFQRLSTTGISQIYGYSSLIYAFSLIGILALFHAIRAALGDLPDRSDPAGTSHS